MGRIVWGRCVENVGLLLAAAVLLSRRKSFIISVMPSGAVLDTAKV